MGFNWKKLLKWVGIVLGCLILLSIIFSTGYWINSSKNERQQKENQRQIDSIGQVQIKTMETLRLESEQLKCLQDELGEIQVEKSKLQNSLNWYKNENYRLQNNYLRSNADKRVEQFTRLATERDTSRIKTNKAHL